MPLNPVLIQVLKGTVLTGEILKAQISKTTISVMKQAVKEGRRAKF